MSAVSYMILQNRSPVLAKEPYDHAVIESHLEPTNRHHCVEKRIHHSSLFQSIENVIVHDLDWVVNLLPSDQNPNSALTQVFATPNLEKDLTTSPKSNTGVEGKVCKATKKTVEQ